MKKLLLIFLVLGLAVGFAACGDDDNGGGEEPPEYFNPIEGEWVWDNNPFYKMIFTDDFYWKEQWLEDGEWGFITIKGTYTITEKTFKSDGNTYNYELIDGKLKMTRNGDVDYFTKYK